MRWRQKGRARRGTSSAGLRVPPLPAILFDLAGRTVCPGVKHNVTPEGVSRQGRLTTPPAGKQARDARLKGGRPLTPLSTFCKHELVGKDHRFTFELPSFAVIVSEANRSRHEHWATTAKRVKYQRSTVGFALAWVLPLEAPRWRVRITRLIGPRGRTLDGDNLVRSCKAIRDGVSDAIGIDDSSDRIAWLYEQERSEFHGVRVIVSADNDACAAVTERCLVLPREYDPTIV